MISIKMARGERSRAHVLMLQALDAPYEHPKNAEQAASAALAEAIAHFSDGTRFSLGELFSLADTVLFYRDDLCGIDTPAVYDLDGLADIVGDRDMARLAISLCGGMFDPETRTWRDGLGHATKVQFESDFCVRAQKIA